MTADLETRLRAHFDQASFEPRAGWDVRVLEKARVPIAPRPLAARTSAIAGRRRRLPLAVAVTMVGIVLAIIALPVAAGSDIPEWAAGLRTAVHVDSTDGGRATSWGSTIELVGAYLDDKRTIIVLKGSDIRLPDAYLVANGHRHKMQEAVTYGGDEYFAVKFEPLGEALSSPVPITLRLADGPTLPPHVWTLNFTIGPRVIDSRSVPDPGRSGSMAITFNSVTIVPGAFAIRFTETGLTYDEVLGPVHISNSGGVQMEGRGPMKVRIQVFDLAGKYLRWLDTQLTPAADGRASVTFSEVLLRTGPGPYRIVISGPTGDSLERTVGA